MEPNETAFLGKVKSSRPFSEEVRLKRELEVKENLIKELVKSSERKNCEILEYIEEIKSLKSRLDHREKILFRVASYLEWPEEEASILYATRYLERLLKEKGPKNLPYFESELGPELTTIPYSLLAVDKPGDRVSIQNFLIKALYPVFEICLREGMIKERLVERWRQVENMDSLINLNNWCVSSLEERGKYEEQGEEAEYWKEVLENTVQRLKQNP
jgi:hypothetical protein